MDQHRYKMCVAVRDLINNKAYSEVITSLKFDLASMIITSNMDQKEHREDLYRQSLAVTLIDGKLRTMANEASMAEQPSVENKLERPLPILFNGEVAGNG